MTSTPLWAKLLYLFTAAAFVFVIANHLREHGEHAYVVLLYACCALIARLIWIECRDAQEP